MRSYLSYIISYLSYDMYSICISYGILVAPGICPSFGPFGAQLQTYIAYDRKLLLESEKKYGIPNLSLI